MNCCVLVACVCGVTDLVGVGLVCDVTDLVGFGLVCAVTDAEGGSDGLLGALTVGEGCVLVLVRRLCWSGMPCLERKPPW